MGVSWWTLILAAALAGIFFSPQRSASQKVPNYTFMHNATSAPDVSYYDYIVIGGGTTGCPLAATLSQNYNVLLLERGGLHYGNPNITNLAAFGAPLSDTSPTSPAQRFISEDGVINSRARILGGGSCLNAGFDSRASLRYVREAGWDEKEVKESHEWVEKVVAFKPRMKQWQSAVRDALVEVGVVPYNGFTYDHIRGTKIGGTIFYQNGFRHSAVDLLQYEKSKPKAHGVLFRDVAGGFHEAYLKRGPKNEIVISAGALGSPQMLMLSGVGPARRLRTHNITVVLDQPLVGQGMSDNPMNAIFVPSPAPVEVSLIQVVGITGFGSYIEAASGAKFGSHTTASNGENFAGISPRPRDYGMLSPRVGQFSKVPPKERTPEALAEAIELMESLDDEAFRGGFILEKIVGPISAGHLELRTRNLNDNPSVTFNYFKEAEDLERCVEGMRNIEKTVESKAFSTFRYENQTVAMLMNMSANSPVNLLPRQVNSSTSFDNSARTR